MPIASDIGMNANFLVGVWSYDKSSMSAEFATGYPIAPNRILTVSHVRKKGHKFVDVEFVFLDKTGENPKIVWDGREKDPKGPDALIIECEFPAEVQTAAQLMEQPNSVDIQWFSNCFPRFARKTDTPSREYLDARGSINPPVDDWKIPLNCTEKRGDAKSWKGASGGPVFTSSGQLAGILCEVTVSGDETASDGKQVAKFERLRAVPIWKLLEISEFVANLGGVSDKVFAEAELKWQKQLISKVRLDLRAIEQNYFFERLEYHFERSIRPKSAELDQLAEELVNVPDQIQLISEIRAECRQKKLTDVVQLLEQIEDHLIPRLFPQAERRRFYNEVRFRGALLIESAGTCPAGIAWRMASIDGKQARLIAAKAGDKPALWRPEGTALLGEMRPGNPTPEQFALSLLIELAEQTTAPDHFPLTTEARREVRSDKVTEIGLQAALNEKEQFVLRMNGWYEARRNRFGSPYCILNTTKMQNTRQILISALQVLRKWGLKMDFLEFDINCRFGHFETPMLRLLISRE